MYKYISTILHIVAIIWLCTINLSLFAANGDVFTAKTVEGVDMTFKVISEANKTCQVGIGSSYNDTAIDKNYSGSITIPKLANGYTVTTIGFAAFSSCHRLTSLTIPNSITSIGREAFTNCI